MMQVYHSTGPGLLPHAGISNSTGTIKQAAPTEHGNRRGKRLMDGGRRIKLAPALQDSPHQVLRATNRRQAVGPNVGRVESTRRAWFRTSAQCWADVQAAARAESWGDDRVHQASQASTVAWPAAGGNGA